MTENDPQIQILVEEFWGRRNELRAAHIERGVQGGAARSGKHMVAIQDFIRDLFIEAGLPVESVIKGSPSLPGYFRRSKSWDVVVIYKGVLVAAIELKSQVGSVGNNANNRIEEAIGNAADIGAVQRNNQTFGEIPPWLGFVLVLEQSTATEAELRPAKTPFAIDPTFNGVTYSKQYQIALSRLVSEKLYDAAWFLTLVDSAAETGYNEPLNTATLATFKSLIKARVDFVRAALGE